MESSTLAILLLIILVVVIAIIGYVVYSHHTATGGGLFSFKKNSSQLQSQSYNPDTPAEYWEHMTRQVFSTIASKGDLTPFFKPWNPNTDDKKPFNQFPQQTQSSSNKIVYMGKEYMIPSDVLDIANYMSKYDPKMTNVYIEAYLIELYKMPFPQLLTQIEQDQNFGTDLVFLLAGDDNRPPIKFKKWIVGNKLKHLYLRWQPIQKARFDAEISSAKQNGVGGDKLENLLYDLETLDIAANYVNKNL